MPVRSFPDMICMIRHLPVTVRRELSIVFDDNHPRGYRRDCLPYIIVISVHINAQQIDLPAEPLLRNQLVDVLSRDERAFTCQLSGLQHRIKPFLNFPNRFPIPVHPQAVPSLEQ